MSAKCIIFVIDSLGDGGAEKSVLTLAEGFVNKGYASYVISIKDHVVYKIPEGVTYRSVFFKKGLGIYRMFTDLRAKKRLKELILDIHREQPVHAVVSNLIFSDTLISGMRLGIPVFSILRNNYSLRFSRKNPLRQWVKFSKLRHTYNRMHLIALAKGIEQDILEKISVCPKSIVTINNPFDITTIQHKADEAGDVPDEPYILHVGRLSRQKRQDILLKAFARSGLPCKLVLLADTSNAADVEKVTGLARELGIDKQLLLPGFQSNPYTWMKKALFYISTSDYEGFPRALVESLVCGTPVMSTNCPSGPDEILGRNSPWLCPVEDVDCLAQTMRKLYKKPYQVSASLYEPYSTENIVLKIEQHIEHIRDHSA